MQGQQQLELSQLPKRASDRSSKRNLQDLRPIPDKLYFSIGEVSDLCLVKPHVLRYWEQEFPQLSPSKRRGSRRYYQRHDILLVRRIKNLLYEQGFTIEGARSKLGKDTKSSKMVGTNNLELLKDIISELEGMVKDLIK